MPNFCENRLTVYGPASQIEKLKNDIDIDGEHPSIANLVPMPEEISECGAGWALEHWGNKWGDSEWWYSEYTDGTLEVKYLTPWTPFHDRFWKKVSVRYPLLQFRISYCEPGNGFAGVDVYANGEQVYTNEIQDINAHTSPVDWTTSEGIDKYNDEIYQLLERLDSDASRYVRTVTMTQFISGLFVRAN